MEKVLGVYRITYPSYGVSQIKNLISHADYEKAKVYKYIQNKIANGSK